MSGFAFRRVIINKGARPFYLSSDTRLLAKPIPFLNWKQHTAGKAVEDALQYIKMYVAEVSANTAKKYLRNVEEQVILLQSKFWSNL